MSDKYDALKSEIEALKKEIRSLKDNQVKQNRDYNDAMHNLDADNIPSLQGIVRKVNLALSQDGNVTAEFVMEVINNESNARIKADRINLNGLVLNLDADAITIDSDNFKVDSDGNLECLGGTFENAVIKGLALIGEIICKSATIKEATMEKAEIRRSCVLGSDIEDSGSAMRIGPVYEDDNCASSAHLEAVQSEDGVSGGYSRGIKFYSSLVRGENIAQSSGEVKAIVGELVADVQKAGAQMSANTVANPIALEKGFVGLKRSDSSTPANDDITAIMRVGDHALWLDGNGNLCTTARKLDIGATWPV